MHVSLNLTLISKTAMKWTLLGTSHSRLTTRNTSQRQSPLNMSRRRIMSSMTSQRNCALTISSISDIGLSSKMKVIRNQEMISNSQLL